jgi:hypothetical protein
MASGEKKLTILNSYIGSLPDDALLYVVVDGVSYKTTKSALLAGISGGSQSLPQVLAVGDRTIRNSDGDGETILELNDRGKLLYNPDGDFLYIPAELYPVGTVIKIHNPFDGIDVFCVPDEELNPSIQINGVNVDEFSGITLNAGTAVFKKINGDPFSETWILTYEVIDFSKDAIGLGSVDNTADLSKPVSTAQAAAIADSLADAKEYTDAIRIKQPVRFAVGTNVTSLSGPIYTDSNLVTTDTILLLAQTDQKENGPWVVNATGAWTRPDDFKTGLDVSFCWIPVLGGTYRSTFFATGAGRIVGSTNISLENITFSAFLTGISFSDGSDITATNNLLQAFGKLQKQLTDVRAAKLDKPSWMSQSTPRTLDNTTALQKIFNVGTSGNGSKPVVAGKRYKVTGWAVFSGLTTSSKTLSFGVLGTASASYVSGIVVGNANAGVGNGQIVNISSFSATQVTSGSAATASRICFEAEFICSVSGNIIPAVSFSLSISGMQVDSAFCFIDEVGASTDTGSSDII